MKSINDVISEIKKRESKRTYITSALEDIRFSEDGKIFVSELERGVYPSEHALTQLESLLRIPGNKFLKGATADIRCIVSNHYQNLLIDSGENLKLKKNSSSFSSDKLAMYVNEADGQICSFTRSDIVRPSISDMIESIADVFELDECVYNYRVTDDGVKLSLVHPRDTEYITLEDLVTIGVGWDISESDYTAKGNSVIYRLVCSNGLTVPEKSSMRSMNLENWSSSDYLFKFSDTTRQLMEKSRVRAGSFRDTLEKKVPDVTGTIRQLQVEHHIKNEVADLIVDCIDYDLGDNMYAVINAITDAANNVDDVKTREFLQNLGGLLLMDDSERCPTCLSRTHLVHNED